MVLVMALLAMALSVGGGQPAAAQSGGIGAIVGFVNGVPEQEPVDIYVDGELTVEGLAYGEVTEGFDLPAGSARVLVAPQGEGIDAAFLAKTTRWDAGAAYVVAAIAGPVDKPEEMLLRTWRLDQGDAPADSGLVQLLHISPDTPSVDVAVEDGDVLISDTGFGDLSASIAVQSGDYTLEMRPAGQTEAVQTVEGVPVQADRNCTVIGLGFLGDDGQLEVVTFYAPLSSAQLADTGTGPADTGTTQPWPWLLGAAALLMTLVTMRDGAAPVRGWLEARRTRA